MGYRSAGTVEYLFDNDKVNFIKLIIFLRSETKLAIFLLLFLEFLLLGAESSTSGETEKRILLLVKVNGSATYVKIKMLDS